MPSYSNLINHRIQPSRAQELREADQTHPAEREATSQFGQTDSAQASHIFDPHANTPIRLLVHTYSSHKTSQSPSGLARAAQHAPP